LKDLIARKHAGLVVDYQRVFSSPEGKRVLMDLMRVHHIMGSTFDENPRVTMLNEGERNVVLRILHKLKTNAQETYKLIEEAERESQDLGSM
jgi:hypothetical protein